MAAVSICSDFGAQEKNIQILELKEKSLVSLRFEKLGEYTKFTCKFKMAVRVTDWGWWLH